MTKLLWLGLAGGLGALARYGLSTLVQRTSGATFPWGTLAVNVLGAFVFGLIWSLVETRLVLSVETRVILLSGFLGGFTTFSSFMFESVALMTDGQWGLAALNLGGQVLAGLVAVFLGLALGRAL
jgi:CrcB protein